MSGAEPVAAPEAVASREAVADPEPAADRGPVADQVRVRADAVVPNRRRGGDIRVTLSPRTVGCGSGFGGVLYLAPGEFVTEHYHPYSEEFLHVVTGELTIALDGRPVTLAPGDSLLVPIGVRHRLVNEGADRAHAVFHLSPLAPRPELGHVDTEEPVAPHAAQPRVGPAPAGASASGAGAAAGSAEPRPEDTR